MRPLNLLGALNEIRIIDHNHRSKLVKITKSQLKRIIKEETEAVLNEGQMADKKWQDNPANPEYGRAGAEDPDGDADDAAELRDIAADLEAKAGKPGGNVERDWEEIHQLGADIEDSGEGSWGDAMDTEALKRGYKSWDHLNKLRSERIATAKKKQSVEDAYGVGGEEFKLRENKITKSQLKQIIKEELQSVLREGGAFASDEEIQDIVDVASKIDPDIQEFSEFYEAARIAWNEGRLKSRYEPSKHELRQAWKKHPGNRFTHDQRLR